MLGELVGGRYRLERELGRGGFGAVYVALQEDLGRRVALKILHRRHLEGVGVERFRREAEIARHLAHPNTVRLFDFGVHDDRPYIVFELLSGESLASLLHRSGPLPLGRAARITAQILKSLMEAHEQGIIHRDIKPANVFICNFAGEPDFVKVLDFGIAKSVADESAALTATGEAIGTPSYMPPEQLSGGALSPATDLYAVGLIMSEMLSGTRLVSGSAMDAALRQMDPSPLPFPPAVRSSPLWPVIERATQKHAGYRYANAGQMLASLGADAALGPTTPLEAAPEAPAVPVPVQSITPSAPKKRGGLLGVLLVLVLGATFLAVALGVAGFLFLDLDGLLGRSAAATGADAGAVDAGAGAPSVEVSAADGSEEKSRGAPTPKAGAAPGTTPAATPSAAPSAGSAAAGGSTLGKACVSNADCKGALEACGAGNTCQCTKTGFGSPRACGGRCVANTDPDNCGGCGIRCANDETCTTNMGGSVEKPICYQCTKGAYGSPRILCGPHVCVAPNTDPRHCGGCNKKCAPGQSCEGGVCK